MTTKVIRTITQFNPDGTRLLKEEFDDGSHLFTLFNKFGSQLEEYTEDGSYYRNFICGNCHEPHRECCCF